MYKQNRKLFITLVLFAVFSKLSAQINASQTSGCAGYFVPVLTGPSGATNILWTVPGQGTTNVSSISPLLLTPGPVVITYTALVNNSPVSYNTTLTVYPIPSASFNYQIPATHCAPMPVSFVATGGGPGVSYSWSFGDLSGIGTGASVGHTYNFGGNFAPVMIVTSAVTGCTAIATNNGAQSIPVSDKPILNITSSAGWSACAPPFITNFNCSSSISGSPNGGGLTFVWSGAQVGGTSPTPPTSTYLQGIHTINLSATDNNFCTNTTSSIVTVINPTVSATIPGTVCLGASVDGVVNTSQAFVYVSGSAFGGVYTHTTIPNNPTNILGIFVASSPGLKNVQFMVNAQGCPPVTVSQNVFVEEVIANFAATSPSASCDRTFAATYINNSTVNNGSTLSFTWTGANGGTAYNQITPSTIYMNNMGNVTFIMSQGSKNPYTIYNYFNPYITLLVQSNSIAQCTASIKQTTLDVLIRPTAYFLRDTMQGCTPLTVHFRDTSFYDPQFAVPASNYTWCNGATPPAYSVGQQTAAFTYTTGTYYPYLVIESPQGCRDTSFYDTITVVPPPLLSATYPPTVCANEPFVINMTGTATPVPSSSTITHWHAETDKGFFSGCITNSSPTWFFTHSGTHSVVITAYQAGCKSTQTLTPTIQVSGPIGKFIYETYCGPNRSAVTFTVFLDDATGATLTFGDGNQQLIPAGSGTTGAVVTHTYSLIKSYTVTILPTTSGGCIPKPFVRVVKLKNPKINMFHNGQPLPIWPEPLACTKSPFNFTTTFTDIALACMKGISWEFITPAYTLAPVNCNDGVFKFHYHYSPAAIPALVDPIMRDTFRLAGDYYITATGRDENGCEVSESHKFRISNAIPNFTWATNPTCFSDNPITLINNTQNSQVAPDLISNYTWYFGDGQFQTSSNPYDNPTHNYGSVAIPSQVFNVICVATNTLGCTDTTVQQLQINNPYAAYNADEVFPCIPLGKGKTVNFTASTGYATYSVNYGDSPGWTTLPSFNNISHSYFLPGTYLTTLTVIDAASCKSTNVLTITALGQPTASFIFETGNKFCKPGQPQMKSNSLANVTPFNNYSWSMKNITTPASPQDSLDEKLPIPGTYTVSLTVSIGPYELCPSTVTNVVYVYDTQGKLEADKTTFCLGESITVKAAELVDVAKWKWFFGDLVPQNEIFNTQFAPNPIKYPYMVYPTAQGPGKTVLSLQLTSPGDGCVVTLTTALQVIKIDAGFTKRDSIFSHCLGKTDVFIKTTPNPLKLTLYHLWDFGDSNRATGDSVANSYKAPGTYPVKLLVRDTIYHCSDTAFKTMIIFPNPTASLLIKDTLVCPSDSFDISGGGSPGAVTATLTSSAGNHPVFLTSNSSFTMPVHVIHSDTFLLRVTDLNGCFSEPVQQTILVPKPTEQVNTGTTVVIGQPIQIDMSVGTGFSYSWTPELLALNNPKIPNPISTTTTDITYTVQIVDEPLHCYLTVSTYSIHVLPLTTVDVPSAFTPNGDGVNDVVYPGGWGIRSLNYFRIFNRWGQLVFESNDLANGWDGTFQGVPQNTETYVWQVEVQTWVDSDPTISKTGTIKLLR